MEVNKLEIHDTIIFKAIKSIIIMISHICSEWVLYTLSWLDGEGPFRKINKKNWKEKEV